MAESTTSDSISSNTYAGDGCDALGALKPGDRLGGYQLLYPVARGGMGQIWAGRRQGRLGVGSLVAIKTALIERDPQNDKLEALFLDEARLAVSIDHPNVCRTFELGDDRGVLFLAMEWIDGASVWDLFKALEPPRRLDYRIAAHIVAEACAGLHAAHELCDEDGGALHVVHRDATPHNILISSNGDVKVVDFGVAKSSAQVHATVTGEFKGKLNYLAPEQVLGRQMDRRADVFALGCVLYLLTTGKRPFHSDNAAGIMLRIVNGDYKLPSLRIPDFPIELETIVVHALALDPDNRFPTAAAMRDALQAFIVNRGDVPVQREDLASLLCDCLGGVIQQRRHQIRAVQRRVDTARDGDSSNFGSTAAPSRAGCSDGTSGGKSSDNPSGPTTEASASILGTAASVPVSPDRVHSRRRNVLLYGTIGALLTATPFAIAAFVNAPQLRPEVASLAPAVAQPAPDPEPPASASPPAPAPALITLTVRANPPDALLVIDEGPSVHAPYTFTPPSDDGEHVIVASATGHLQETRVVRFDRSQTVDINLTPMSPQVNHDSYRTRPLVRGMGGAETDTIAGSPAAAKPTQEPTDIFATTSSRKKRRAIDESDPFSE